MEPFNSRPSQFPRHVNTNMSREDIESGKQSKWTAMQIDCGVKNINPYLWRMTHLTDLYLSGNKIQVSLREYMSDGRSPVLH